MSFVRGMRCRICGRDYPSGPIYYCEDCCAPVEIVYDYPAIARVISREIITQRPHGMWRYRELLPLEGEPTVGLQVGGTPLVRASRLARILGVDCLWIKNDAVNFPTLSFKDRVVAVALAKAREFGFRTVGCASTGNLANSVAALAAASGLDSYIFVPADLEAAKILNTSIYGARVIKVRGTYDEVNRLCQQVADRYHWGLVNVNLRPFYADGSRTMGFEIAEQLGWRTPGHVIAPMAGGSLVGKIHQSFQELYQVGLLRDQPTTRMYGAQPSGCSPICTAVKNGWDEHRPVRTPNTICKSLAVGDPADGYFAGRIIRDSGGWAEDVSDAEIVEGMALLGRTEGIFAETAGGCTVAVLRKLLEQGRIPRAAEVVLIITGNGLKTQDAVAAALEEPAVIGPTLEEFEPLVAEPTLV